MRTTTIDTSWLPERPSPSMNPDAAMTSLLQRPWSNPLTPQAAAPDSLAVTPKEAQASPVGQSAEPTPRTVRTNDTLTTVPFEQREQLGVLYAGAQRLCETESPIRTAFERIKFAFVSELLSNNEPKDFSEKVRLS